MAFSLDGRGHSETGLVRKNNQDSGYLSPTALVIADGMGGAAAGDLASTVAITHVAAADGRFEGEEMLTALTGAVSRANDKLADLVNWDAALDGMGTTVCGGFFSGTQLGLVHIGDSRGYLLRDDKLHRLTHDHSWVQSLIDEGKIDEEQAASHPHRSLLLRVLNGQPSSDTDTSLVDLHEGDRLLFCSDGLSGFTTEDELGTILSDLDLDEAIEALVQAAYSGGGADNITMVLADVVPQSDELDAREPEIIGAAAQTPIPDISTTSRIDLDDDAAEADDARLATAPTPRAPAPRRDPRDPERLRYLPDGAGRRKRWLSTSVLLLALIVVLGSAAYFGRNYVNRQYYVGEAGNQVAIYNGVQGHLPGLSLNHVYEQSATKLSDLPVYFQNRVRDTIDADNLEAARATSHELSMIAQRCINERATRATATATPTQSVTPGHSPTPGASGTPNQSPTNHSVTPAPTASPGTASATASNSATVSPTPGNGASTPAGEQDCP